MSMDTFGSAAMRRFRMAFSNDNRSRTLNTTSRQAIRPVCAGGNSNVAHDPHNDEYPATWLFSPMPTTASHPFSSPESVAAGPPPRRD